MTLADTLSTLRSLLIADSEIDAAWVYTDDDESTPIAEARRRSQASPGIAIWLAHPAAADMGRGNAQLILRNEVVITLMFNPRPGGVARTDGRTAKGILARLQRVMKSNDPGRLGNRFEPPSGGDAWERNYELSELLGCQVYHLFVTSVSSEAELSP